MNRKPKARATIALVLLVLTACGTPSVAPVATTTPNTAPALFAIDALVRATAAGALDLHVRYAEREGDTLRVVLALYNNGSDDLLAVPGITLANATLNGSAPTTTSASFAHGVVPDGGWLAGGASNGDLVFEDVLGPNYALAVPGFPSVMFRLDTPLRATPEPASPTDGTTLLGLEAQSDDMPGIRLVLQRADLAADGLTLSVAQVVDASVARTDGINFDNAVIFDARWNQYRPDAVDADPTMTAPRADGDMTPFTLHFARPQAGDTILLRVQGFPLIRLPLRVDDEAAWATASDLPPSWEPRTAFAVPSQPLVPSDDPDSAFEQVLATLNLALEAGDRERYLDAFVPAIRAEQAALFERIRALPLQDVRFTAADTADTVSDPDGSVTRSVLWTYRVRDVDPENIFSSAVDLAIERDGDGWRIGSIQGALPFWASGATEASRTGAFWIFFRPDERDALATVEQDVAAAFGRVSATLPEAARGPFVMFVTATADEFAQQTGRDPTRFVGAALSRWSYQNDAIHITSAAFVINGAVFRADPTLDREQTITHELTHLVLAQQTMPFTPLWLVEGMAMHVSTDVPTATMQVIRDGGELEAWRLDEFTALRRFGEHDPQGQQTATEYAYSAYLVRYLVETYGFERTLAFYTSFATVDGATIAEDMAAASNPDEVETMLSTLASRLTASSLQSTFGVDLPTFEQNFKAWVAIADG